MSLTEIFDDEAEDSVSGAGNCELCQRDVQELTRHHLIPQCRHSNKKNKKNFDRKDVKTRIALLCRPCHKNVHNCIENKVLENSFNTLDLLLAHAEILKFTQWIKTKPDGTKVPFPKKTKSKKVRA